MHQLLRDYLTNEKNKASVNERSGQGCAGSAPDEGKRIEMIVLSDEYKDEISRVLGDDCHRCFEMINDEPFKGISVNRLKITPERLLPLLPFAVEKSPFYEDGYCIKGNAESIGKSPLHHAGAFYVQEPSASSAVSLLGVRPGERVLDLCAAPGGKSAQIASCLGGSGLIWSNEVVKSRAQILLSNFERMGIANGVVSSCYPEILCGRLSGFFDRVLVDAPCSGEGMFRKNPAAFLEWSREHVISCAERQISILNSASAALRPGGILVYSTCTFSYEENEGVIKEFLRRHDDFEECSISAHFGRRTELGCAVRITPLEGGEGHFAAKLRKKGGSEEGSGVCSAAVRPSQTAGAVQKELAEIFVKAPAGIVSVNKDKAYILPEGLPDMSGLGVIRAGILAGEFKKNRFEPAHSLFTAFEPSCFRRVLELSLSDSRTVEYLRGMELDCDLPSGYAAVSIEGMTAGFGKCSSSRLKNKYPKGLRDL